MKIYEETTKIKPDHTLTVHFSAHDGCNVIVRTLSDIPVTVMVLNNDQYNRIMGGKVNKKDIAITYAKELNAINLRFSMDDDEDFHISIVNHSKKKYANAATIVESYR